MNYDLSFVTTDGSDLNHIINILEEMSNTITTSNENMIDNWLGVSYSKYNGLTESLKERYNEKISELREVISLISLITEHNLLRKERDNCKSQISELVPHLYYTVVNEEGETETHCNHHIKTAIENLEEKIRIINDKMDQIIIAIKGITGG